MTLLLLSSYYECKNLYRRIIIHLSLIKLFNKLIQICFSYIFFYLLFYLESWKEKKKRKIYLKVHICYRFIQKVRRIIKKSRSAKMWEHISCREERYIPILLRCDDEKLKKHFIKINLKISSLTLFTQIFIYLVRSLSLHCL